MDQDVSTTPANIYVCKGPVLLACSHDLGPACPRGSPTLGSFLSSNGLPSSCSDLSFGAAARAWGTALSPQCDIWRSLNPLRADSLEGMLARSGLYEAIRVESLGSFWMLGGRAWSLL
jgi:hypothetical protein